MHGAARQEMSETGEESIFAACLAAQRLNTVNTHTRSVLLLLQWVRIR